MANLDDIKAALLALSPTGPLGFEGLLAAVLGQISGQPFRLARSGSQGGRDGDTLDQTSHISFECKLYTNPLSGPDVQAKITQLAGSPNPPDVWVLAATVEAGSQLVGVIRGAASRIGLNILVCDWPENTEYPPLAVAMAMAGETTIAFLRANVAEASLVEQARLALESLSGHPEFDTYAQTLGSELRASSLGMANARAANNQWLSEIFADRAKARAALGQALAPQAPLALPLRSRDGLTSHVKSHFLSPPARSVLAVVGGEGHGKSWLVAESWLELEARPLLLVVSATDMNPAAAFGEFRASLVSWIIRQTSEQADDQVRRRWLRRMELWSAVAAPEQPRFVVWIDGLNEQPTFEWRRWLDDAAAEIETLGGALIVTVREAFYNERLRRSLNVPITVVNVPGWSVEELEELLRSQGIEPSHVAANVRERLRNPRILGIAARLLNSAEIQSFTELSVGRLLFEHIRASAIDGTTSEEPDLFGSRLAAHAREIIERVVARQADDTLVFDRLEPTGHHVVTRESAAVTAEQFFSALPGEPRLYTLPDAALGLALGFAIIEALRRAHRNGRNVEEALNELLEPISALDKTADAVFAALLVASVDEHVAQDITAALFIGFVSLQNIDEGYYRPLVGVVRSAAKAALSANEQLLVSDRTTSNHAWLTTASREARADPASNAVIGTVVSRWLTTYSLDPRLSVFSSIRDEGREAYDTKVAEQESKIATRIANLRAPEAAFLEGQLVRRDGIDPSRLHAEACELLAGVPLAGFAQAIVGCAFSNALNSSHRDAYDDLVSLVRFNRVDWTETRDAILTACQFLDPATGSVTGKWALVHLLRALSRPEDGELASQLIEELTVDREHFGAWRRVENFSASDPCDPSSTEPDNLPQAAGDYAAISVADLTRSRSMGMADHNFKDARPAMARFRPEVGISKIREYLRAALGRDGEIRRLAITSIEHLGSALDQPLATELLTTAAEIGGPRDSESQESRTAWITAQYAIQIGLPHLNGDAQLDYMMGIPTLGSPLIKFGHVVKPASPEKLAAFLNQALETQDHCRALMALSFARHSGTALNREAKTAVVGFLSDSHSSVRAIALDVIAHAEEADLLSAFVERDWRLSPLDPKGESFERWYGSLSTIGAAHAGLRQKKGVLDNVVPELFGYAAKRLGTEAERDVAGRLHAAINRALDIEIPFTPPLATQRISNSEPPKYGFLDLVESKPETGIEGFIKRMNETDEEFDARHKSYWESFRDFEQSLTQQDARVIIQDVGDGAVEALIRSAPEVAINVARRLLALDDSAAYRLASFALRLAKGLSSNQPNLASELFQRFAGETGVINYIYGASSVSLAAMTIWEAAESPELEALRHNRLDVANTDHDLAQEVVAALRAGRGDFLDLYARQKLQSEVPADHARGMMVLGFGVRSEFADEVLARPTASEGLLGKAQRAAEYAYERNVWAEAWFADMLAAETAEEFWAKSVLFLKIVDGRFDVWNRTPAAGGSVAAAHLAGIADEIRRRSSAWKTHREKTLCGDKVPGLVFSL